MFERVLIANRGEIALRILRALRGLGCSVAIIHGREDRLSLPVRMSDVAIPIYSDNPLDTYLDYERVIEAAKQVGIVGGFGKQAAQQSPCFRKVARGTRSLGGFHLSGPALQVVKRLLAGDDVVQDGSGLSKREWRELMDAVGWEA